MEDTAVLAAGCFWCYEAVFQEVIGVIKVVTGYTGGIVDNPTDQRVYRGDTGHAEAFQITFDPGIITYRELLEIFYYVHDPTTLNRQGYDVGDEYRSAIFYNGEEQKQIAEEVTTTFAPTLWDDPIVTQLVPVEKFWPAADYHQNFYRSNPEAGYCQVIINPKLKKFRAKFESKLKK